MMSAFCYVCFKNKREGRGHPDRGERDKEGGKEGRKGRRAGQREGGIKEGG